jgi:hypothetical protein
MNYKEQRNEYKNLQDKFSQKSNFVKGVVKNSVRQIGELIMNDLVEIEVDGAFRLEPEIKNGYDGSVMRVDWTISFIDFSLTNQHNAPLTLFEVVYEKYSGASLHWQLWDTMEWSASRNQPIIRKVIEKIIEKNTLTRVGELISADIKSVDGLYITDADKDKRRQDELEITNRIFTHIKNTLLNNETITLENEFDFTFGKNSISANKFSFVKDNKKNSGVMYFWDEDDKVMETWTKVSMSSLYRIIRDIVWNIVIK